jgi:hypothetical protein
MKSLSKENIEKLAKLVKGRIFAPDDPKYNELRKIWNAMIDRRPAVILQCAEAQDAVHALAFARENGLKLSIRGGGHNIAGSVCRPPSAKSSWAWWRARPTACRPRPWPTVTGMPNSSCTNA